MFLSNSEKMRYADNTAIFERGIDSLRLMETAAAHVAECAFKYVCSGGSAWIFCGSGNNGGDGVAAALWLMNKGIDTRVLLVGSPDRLTEDTAEMRRRLEQWGGKMELFDPDSVRLREEISRAGVIIDAMFGIGLNKALGGRAAAAVELINASSVPVVSADIASGVEADTGRILGCAVKATETVSFSLAKPGHFSQPGNVCCGRLHVVDIGIPQDIVRDSVIGVQVLDDVKLPRRKAVSHKGDYGKLLILAGCSKYCGAPNLCSNAAVRSGAGLVYLGVPASIHGICAVKNSEAMPLALPEDESGYLSAAAFDEVQEKLRSCNVCLVGPGMGRSRESAVLIEKIASCFEGTLVLDADALWALGQDMSILRQRKGYTVLTPHDGEFALMGGRLSGDRIGDASEFAREHGVCLVLKGHRSIAAFPDGRAFISPCGNPGMAKGGSGDVLAGIMAALIGQLGCEKGVCAGLYLHGFAGDLCRDEYGEYSMSPSDIIAMLPRATMNLMEE